MIQAYDVWYAVRPLIVALVCIFFVIVGAALSRSKVGARKTV